MPGSGLCHSQCLLPGSYLCHCVDQLSPEKVKSSTSHLFLGPLRQAFYLGGEGKVLVSGRCGENGERLQQALLDEGWPGRRGGGEERHVGKGLMQESGKREQCGCLEVAGIPPSFLPCFGVMRDRARSSGSSGWSLEDKNPAAQQEVHRGHP